MVCSKDNEFVPLPSSTTYYRLPSAFCCVENGREEKGLSHFPVYSIFSYFHSHFHFMKHKKLYNYNAAACNELTVVLCIVNKSYRSKYVGMLCLSLLVMLVSPNILSGQHSRTK
jgi:hypothetical protein